MKSCINHHSKCETSSVELVCNTVDLCLRIFVPEDFCNVCEFFKHLSQSGSYLK